MKTLTLFALLLTVTGCGGRTRTGRRTTAASGQHDSFCDYSECSIERIGHVVLHRSPIQRRRGATAPEMRWPDCDASSPTAAAHVPGCIPSAPRERRSLPLPTQFATITVKESLDHPPQRIGRKLA